MSNVRGLFDQKREARSNSDPADETDSFAGGHKSGLAIQYPKQASKSKLRIKIFTDGIEVEGGKFTALSKDQLQVFLDDLQNQIVPEELRDLADQKGELSIEVEHVGTPYTKSEAGQDYEAAAVFTGTGVSLGDPGAERVQSEEVTGLTFPVYPIDPCSPVTTIQIRLPGGTRVARKFNEATTGSVLLSAISIALTTEPANIIISSGFPPKPLAPNDIASLSLKELGLSNASVNVTIRR